MEDFEYFSDSDTDDFGKKLEQYRREEAARRVGIPFYRGRDWKPRNKAGAGTSTATVTTPVTSSVAPAVTPDDSMFDLSKPARRQNTTYRPSEYIPHQRSISDSNIPAEPSHNIPPVWSANRRPSRLLAAWEAEARGREQHYMANFAEVRYQGPKAGEELVPYQTSYTGDYWKIQPANNNRRTRPIDRMVREEQEEENHITSHETYHEEEAAKRSSDAPPPTETEPLGRELPRASALPPTSALPPKSALQAIVQERDLGDSTIASLEGIINPNTEDSGALKFTENAESHDAPPVSSNEDRRDGETFALDNMNKHLSSTQLSIKDANRGLRRIENQIEAIETKVQHDSNAQRPIETRYPIKLSRPVSEIPKKLEIAEVPAAASSITIAPPPFPAGYTPYTDHNGRTCCAHCGGLYSFVWLGLWVEFRELFWTYDPLNNYRLQLTWLALTLVATGAYFILETIASSILYGLFPFTIPAMIVWPFHLILESAFELLGWLFGIFYNVVSGEVVARPASSKIPTPLHAGKDMDWGGSLAAAATATGVRLAHSTLEAIDQYGGMWEDGLA